MKYTLLDLVQTVLSSMDSDEVNSITDTVEAQQVAKVVRTAYYDIVTRDNLPEHFTLVTLDPSNDLTKPVIMYLPDEVSQLLWLKYDCHTVSDTRLTRRNMQYQDLQTFLDRMDMLNTSDTNVASFTHTVGADTFTIVYQNDHAPTYYTSFDDHTFIFNAYDAAVDTTLQKSKTLGYGITNIPWTMADTFVPDLNDQQFALLLNESKSLAWAELKQAQNPKAEQAAKRGWTNLQRNKTAANPVSQLDRLPNYGRK